jgi:hypothetical protein
VPEAALREWQVSAPAQVGDDDPTIIEPIAPTKLAEPKTDAF